MLIETGFFSKPFLFDAVIFQLKSEGFTPILAHPERYTYLEADLNWLRDIREQGVKLQVTLASLVGGYGKQVQTIARKLMKSGMADFLGSDIHRVSQIPLLKKALKYRIGKQRFLNGDLI